MLRLIVVTLIAIAFFGSAWLAISTVSAANKIPGLTKELQDKPMVAEIYASWCTSCKNIAPTLSAIQKKYGTRIRFITFDVSDNAKAQRSGILAKRLGLGSFFEANKSHTSTVVVIDPATGTIQKQLINNSDQNAYTTAIDSFLKKPKGNQAIKSSR